MGTPVVHQHDAGLGRQMGHGQVSLDPLFHQPGHQVNVVRLIVEGRNIPHIFDPVFVGIRQFGQSLVDLLHGNSTGEDRIHHQQRIN